MGGFCSKYSFVYCYGDKIEYEPYDAIPFEHSCWPCTATGLYQYIPSKGVEHAAEEDAKILYNCLHGCGTYDTELARLLLHRTTDQIQDIKKAFIKLYDTTLEEMIGADTSFDWKRFLLSIIANKPERDAKLVNAAIKGLGTEDTQLRVLLCTPSYKHLQAMDQEYIRLFEKTMASDVKADTSFNYKQTLMATIHKADYLAERLSKAMKEGPYGVAGTDDSRLIRILTSIPRSKRTWMSILNEFDDPLSIGFMQDLERELSMPDLQDVKAAYFRIYGRDLAADIDSETSLNYKHMLLALLEDPAVALAHQFHECMVEYKMGTNDNMLIELCTTRSRRLIQEAAVEYERLYGMSLEEQMRKSTSGDYLEALLALAQPISIPFAKALKDAYDLLGTDDSIVINILGGKPRRDIRDVTATYAKLYGQSLAQRTKSETSFWYSRALNYQMNQAFSSVTPVFLQSLKRIQDL